MKSAILNIVIFLTCLSILGTLNAQSSSTADSLRTLIRKAKSEQKANILIQLAEHYYTISPDSIYKYSRQALELSKELNNEHLLAKSYNSVGVYFYNKKSIDSAQFYYQRSLGLNRSLKNINGITVNLANLGTVFYAKGHYQSALEHYLEASEYEEIANKISYGTLTNIGLLLSNLDRHDEALEYLHRDLENAKKLKDLSKQIPSRVNIASTWIRAKNFDSAYYNANLAVKGSTDINMNYGIGKSLIVMANACVGLQKFDEGIRHINSSIDLFKKLNISYEIVNALAVKATLFEKDKKYDKVLKVIDQAKSYCGDNKDQLYLFSEAKYKSLKALGRNGEALETYENYIKIKDSLYGEETRKQIVDLEQKYKHEKNQRRIEELKQATTLAEFKAKHRTMLLIAISGFLLLVIATILFTVWKKQISNRVKLLQIEQRLNRVRINPHFFFNALSSMQTLALTTDKSKIASYMSKFANVMRKALDSSYEEMVSIEEELIFMREYLEVQQLRFPDKFEHKIDFDRSLELDELKIPSMLLQPFVENAIEHGFKSSDNKGILVITIKDLEAEVLISVEDNGKEFLSQKPKTYKSRALSIIKDRLILFNKRFKTKASFKVDPSEGASGYKVSVLLPKLYTV